jgi:hypothetical protein
MEKLMAQMVRQSEIQMEPIVRRIGFLFLVSVALYLVAFADLDGILHESQAQDSRPPLIFVRDSLNGRILTPQSETRLEVVVTDRNGNPLTDVGVLFVAPESGPGGSFRGAMPAGATFFRTRTNPSGVASATFVANAMRGVYLVDAIVEGTEAATSFAMTNVPRRVNPALAPDKARLAVLQRLLAYAVEDETLRLHGPVLLEAGTRVASAGEDSFFFPTMPFTTDKRTWLLWVDEEPSAMFAHPTRFILLNASDTTPDLATEARATFEGWWPEVTLPGETTPNSLLPPSYSNSTVPPPASTATDASPAQEESTTQPPDACAIVLYGPNLNGNSGKNTADKMKKFLMDNQLVPASNIYTSGTAQTPPTSTDPPASAQDLERLLNLAKSNNCKKLYLFINAHGDPRGRSISPEGIISFGGGLELRGDTSFQYKRLASLLAPLKGTELCIILDSCYSGEACEWVQGLDLTGTFVSSADRHHTSFYKPKLLGFGESVFTPALLTCWGDGRADTNGDGKVTLKEAYDWVIKTNTDPGVIEPQPKESSIAPDVPRNYPLEDVCIPEPEVRDEATIVIRRPEGVPLSTTFRATLTINDPGVAVFVGFFALTPTIEVFILSGKTESDPITIRGVKKDVSVTSYTLMGRDDTTGQAFRGFALIQVGGTKGQPVCVDKVTEGTFDVTFIVDRNPGRHPDLLKFAGLTVKDGLLVGISGDKPETATATGFRNGATCQIRAAGQANYAGFRALGVYQNVRFGGGNKQDQGQGTGQEAITISGEYVIGAGGELPGGQPIIYSFTGTLRR